MRTGRFAMIAVFLFPGALFGLPPDLAEVLRELSDSERKLRNLMIAGEVIQERLRPGERGDEWVPSGVLSEVTLWHNGAVGGPIRVDVHRSIEVWSGEGAGAPFHEGRWVAAYDGVEGRVVFLLGGAAGKARPVSTAEIFPNRPRTVDGLPYTDGRMFSIFFSHEGAGKSLSDYIAQRAREATEFADGFARVSQEQLDGLDVVRLEVGRQPFIVEKWWLDPARGYSVLRYVHEFQNSTLQQGFVVLKLAQVAEDVWYPQEGIYEIHHQPRMRWLYKASEIRANDPNFDDGIFRITIPAGFSVRDHARGEEFMTPMTEQQLSDDLEAIISDIPPLVPSNQPPEQRSNE